MGDVRGANITSVFTLAEIVGDHCVTGAWIITGATYGSFKKAVEE